MSHGPLWKRIWTNLRDEREARRVSPVSDVRDMRAAVGRAGGPGSWKRAVDGAGVALHQRDWADSRWSSIYRRDSAYASVEAADPAVIADANLRGRRGAPPSTITGPFMKAPVWTWEVPLYFWFGGMAAGSTFVAFACDVAGDRRSARIARLVAFGALMPSPPLLIMDLGRPERFYNMLRIFKPRSPMSMGSWCLSLFGGVAFGAVAADFLGRDRLARRLGAVNVPVGAYLGSYTGVLLASTAVPLWGRSRAFLGPIFISTATLTGAATTRLVLSATGLDADHPTRVALARVEDAAIASELILTAINERRLGPHAEAFQTGMGARWFEAASWFGRAGLAARVVSKRVVLAEHLASASYMAAALCYRMAWVKSGRSSAEDNASVAEMARDRAEPYAPPVEAPAGASVGTPAPAPAGAPVLRVTQHGTGA